MRTKTWRFLGSGRSVGMRYDEEFKTFAIEYYEEVRSLRKAAADLKISCSTLQ